MINIDLREQHLALLHDDLYNNLYSALYRLMLYGTILSQRHQLCKHKINVLRVRTQLASGEIEHW